MKIHEYQGKQLFARYGVPIPKGYPAFTPDEAEAAAKKLIEETGIAVTVVKAQIHAGGRGKGGGVKLAKNGPKEARELAEKMLGMQLVTHQTGPAGQKVRRLYIEQGLDIGKELYLALVVDREARRVAIMASTEGGMDIEAVAHDTPEKIHTLTLDPVLGMAGYQARKLAYALGIQKHGKAAFAEFVQLCNNLYKLFVSEDCSLLEINPLIVTKDGHLVALDAKINFDENSEFRHAAEWGNLRDEDEEDPIELEAKKAGLSYVSLDGNIGCLVNGAGLAMATMDIIKSYGGEPANFLDVGGGANQEQVTKAFGMILKSPKVRGIFVNIFGGIMKCDVIAEGVVAATKELGLKVPLVVRLEGTNVELGKKILADSGLAIQPANDMGDGAKKIVEATRGLSKWPSSSEKTRASSFKGSPARPVASTPSSAQPTEPRWWQASPPAAAARHSRPRVRAERSSPSPCSTRWSRR
jgi:succinyl-CoA synthetase beta subunit